MVITRATYNKSRYVQNNQIKIKIKPLPAIIMIIIVFYLFLVYLTYVVYRLVTNYYNKINNYLGIYIHISVYYRSKYLMQKYLQALIITPPRKKMFTTNHIFSKIYYKC